ncbi:GcrA family cell cycle regulator [Chelatococcus reniformis]|uniref:GcrA cell cycle regulator n=1 Tax=Chelatococcus reniformis TaxID=1494448 RepID=A0A916UVZ2_9HYPH|nr:GcrA family cell cycle regulator [Chelatococcus reniformis]GGC90611.1 hypothetical protein GCM10010994_55520 [Chelatococcus reniformis]
MSISAAAGWTKERVALAVDLRSQGKTFDDIAATLGVTKGAVAGKLDRVLNGRVSRTKARPRPSKPVAPAAAVPARVVDDVEPIDLAAWRPAKRAEPTFGPRTITELEPCHCRWPLDRPSGQPLRFCGKRVLHPRTRFTPFYCAEHVSRAYTPAGLRQAQPGAAA